jgi:CHAT domain-containing protein
MQGLISSMNGLHADAWSQYERALQLFVSARDLEGSTSAHERIAQACASLGRDRAAWVHRVLALDGLETLNPARRASLLDDAASAARDGGHLHAALDLHDEATRLASGSANDRAVALLFRSENRNLLGDRVGALRDAAEARSLIPFVSQPGIAMRTTAMLCLAEASLETSRPEKARVLLDQSVQLSNAAGMGEEFRAAALLARGRLALASADVARAEHDFDEGIAALDELQPRQRQFGIPFFGRAADVYDEMVRLQACYRKRPEQALEYVERERARALRTAMASMSDRGAGAHLSCGDIRARLPEDVALIYYFVDADRLLSWVLRRSGITSVERRISAAALRSAAAAFCEAVARGDDGHMDGAVLYDNLIAPLDPALRGTRTLVLVPDGPLNSIPFAALWDRPRARYLVEEWSLALSPGGAVFTKALERARALEAPGVPARVLVAVAPDTAVPSVNLSRLRGAEEEAREIQRLWPEARMLEHSAATPRGFLAEASQSTIVHFAGHAIANARDPELSCLVLEPGDGEDRSGVLFADRIAATPWRRTRLVVLGGCGTASGANVRGEGVLSLARPFLAGGVPAVVGTVQSVADAASRSLLTRLHRALVAGLDGSSALRDAQISMIRDSEASNRPPSNWAPFVLIGATCDMRS